jgi:site-specific recombinase XerD
MRVLIPTGEWEHTLADYVRWLGASKQPLTTQKLRSYHLRRFAVETGLQPRDVADTDLLDWLSRPEWSRAYARSFRTTFRSFFRWAAKSGLVAEDPAVDLPVISVAPGVPRPAGEDAVQFGIMTSDERTRLMVRLAAEAGLRCREIALVQTRDVLRDVDGYHLHVHGKGDKERVVPLTDALAARILEHPPGYLFPGRDNGHLSAPYVSKLVSRALPVGVSAHPLRHRFASITYVGTGGDIRAVQELLGHSSVATTQVYTKVPDGAKRRGVLAAAVLTPH